MMRMMMMKAVMMMMMMMICTILLLLVMMIQSSSSFSPRFSTTCRSAAAAAAAAASFSSSSSQEDWISKVDAVVEEPSSLSSSAPAPAVKRRRLPVIRRADAASLERLEQAQEEILQARQRQETAQQDPNLLSGLSFAQVLMMDDNDNDNDDGSGGGGGSKQHSLALLRALQQDLGKDAKMTRIQAATYRPARQGCSILARARTGTGKTLAFLVPLVERLLANHHNNINGQRSHQVSIGILIVVPTRELAVQIADTATRLVQYTSSPRILVQTVHGGTNIQRHVRMLATNPSVSSGGSSRSTTATAATVPPPPPSILVATPGRLLDLMKERIRGSTTFQQVLHHTPMLVMDECDFLVQGFYRETQQILQALPRKDKRQTLLFSATTPRRVQRLLRNVADSGSSSNGNNNNSDDDAPTDYVEILDVDKDPQYLSILASLQETTSSSTPQQEQQQQQRVQESYIILPDMKLYVSALLALVERAVQQERQRQQQQQQQGSNGNSGSIIIFFPTTRLVKYFATLFRQRQDHQRSVVILEMHSQMSPSARQRVSAAFRQQEKDSSSTSSSSSRGRSSSGGGPIKILFTSDVSARGLDYPNVNLVVQYGLPSSRELYSHRLGRTARCGNQGRGLLVALPFEQVSHVVAVVKKNSRNKRRDGRQQPSPPLPPQSSIVQDEELSRLVESSQDDWREELESMQKQVKDATAAVSMTDSSSGGGGARRRSRNAAQPNYSPLGPAALAAYSSFVAYYVEHAPRRGVSMSEIRQSSEAFGRGALGLVQLPELPTTLADKLGAGD